MLPISHYAAIPGFNPEWIDTSPVNRDGVRVKAHVTYQPNDGALDFRCREEHYAAAHAAWCKFRRDARARGNESFDKIFPCPMPSAHCMFENPEHYSRVPHGCEDGRMIRRARRNRILANLSGGWDRELRKTIAGLKTLNRIADWACDNPDCGAAPYVACITSML